MTQDTPKLWTPRSVEDTQKVYANWAESYDKDVTDWGYATPARVAEAAAQFAATDAPVLDFGCGTGLSGLALKAAGFTQIDGTDVSPEMLEHAKATNAYRTLSLGTPGSAGGVQPGAYTAIIATGVVSLGAAPPETLDMLLNALGTDCVLVFSYNDPTLGNADYMQALDAAKARPDIELLFEGYGPHLANKNMNSSVYVLKHT